MDEADAFDIDPFFLDSALRPLFCLRLVPTRSPVRAQVLYLHPFAEEMNRSRRMAALQARRLAALGYEVLQVDLTGCGDSWGDFADASWPNWQSDVMHAADWLRQGNSNIPLILWGLRLGASLAVQVDEARADIHALLLWQPIIDGSVFLNQFLRLKQVSDMLSERAGRASVQSCRKQLSSGRPVEVAGYMLSPELAAGITALRLAEFAPRRVGWIELPPASGLSAPPSSHHAIEAWRAKGCTLDQESVVAEPFWSTQEITVCPALIETTAAMMERLTA